VEGRWLQDSVYQNSKLKFLGGLKYGSSIRSQVSKCMGEQFMSEVVRIGKLDPEKMMTPQKNATSICLRYVTIKSFMFLDLPALY